MSIKDQIKKEVEELFNIGIKMAQQLLRKENKENSMIHVDYQLWYTRALKAVEFLAPDRYNEFKSYYEIDTKRKHFGYGTYVIQDYLKGVVPAAIPSFDTEYQTSQNVLNQSTILKSLLSRIDSILSAIESGLYVEIQDAEMKTAKKLTKDSPRASGALAGVILEGYLQKIAKSHGVQIKKQNPTISDLNEPLRQAGIYDMPTWRKITYLADLRNLCSHKKSDEPSIEQVNELIQGVTWVCKNVS